MEQEQPTFATIEDVQRAMFAQHYIADRSLATAVYLALKRRKPLLLEGEPGVGKTEVAKVLAAILDTKLIRLQCYEGIDVSTAVYEWNYTRQMLHIRLMEAGGMNRQDELKEIFGPDFLMQRPLLQAIDPANARAPVLLIDELDRSDEEFEAYLLELLSDFERTSSEARNDASTCSKVGGGNFRKIFIRWTSQAGALLTFRPAITRTLFSHAAF